MSWRSARGNGSYRVSRAVALGAFFVLPCIVWALAAGQNVARYWIEAPPPGQLSYVFSRFFALSAVCLLAAQVLTGLLRRQPECPPAFRWSTALHRCIGLTVVTCMIMHIGLFIAAVAARTGETPWNLLVPVVNGDFYRTSITVGSIAMSAILLAAAAGIAMHRRSRIIRLLHWAAPSAAVLVAVHSVLIGSESRVLLGILAMMMLATLAAAFRGRVAAAASRP